MRAPLDNQIKSLCRRVKKADKEIVMDIKDQRDKYYVYRGYLNKEGNLVVDRGVIHVQGSFQPIPHPMVFKKVY